jgi:hypothetical protein
VRISSHSRSWDTNDVAIEFFIEVGLKLAPMCSKALVQVARHFLVLVAKGTFLAGSRTFQRSRMPLAIWARDGVHDIGLRERTRIVR